MISIADSGCLGIAVLGVVLILGPHAAYRCKKSARAQHTSAWSRPAFCER